MNKIELLAPAGNLEKAKIAILYGRGAVYVGGNQFSFVRVLVIFPLMKFRN